MSDDPRLALLADFYMAPTTGRAARVLEAVDTEYEDWARKHRYDPDNLDAMRKWVSLRQEWEEAQQ